MQFEYVISGLTTYMLVFCRVAGMIFFNPLLSRRNVPSMVRIGLVLLATVLMVPSAVGIGAAGEMDTFQLVFSMTVELLVGMACGILFQIYYYMLFMAGDMIDMGFGLSMAKSFDPTTNLQISLSGNLFQFVFIMYFFATDSHLIFIRLIASSYDIVGIGAMTFGDNVGSFMINIFISAFNLAISLSAPFIAASFVLEVSMGLLMKLIPQLSIFTIHFQMKMLFGFILLFLFATPVSEFMNSYINEVLVNIQSLFQATTG